MKRLIYFLALLVTSTLIIIIDNAITYKHSQIIAEDATKLQALAVAVSLESALKDYNIRNTQFNLFEDIINEGKWEGIAFIGLYANDGLTLLHSNSNLIGRHIKDDIIKRASDREEIIYEYLLLGTGERVFTINMPIHTLNITPNPILRVAIHTFQMERLKGMVRLKLTAMLFVLCILWLFGIFLFLNQKKSERLQQKMLQKERFVHIGEMAAVLAHEIRNPLGSIKGFSQYLYETAEGDKQRDALKVIIDESSRLEVLTDELLIYARPIEIKTEPVRLSSLIEDTIKRLGEDFTEIDFQFKGNMDRVIHTDRDKLIQILINIFNNAKDAMDKRGTIEIEFLDNKEGTVIIIRDSGTGIKEDIMDKVFNPFFTTKTRGTGLGLSIVKRLIESLEGSIDIKNLSPKGAEVRLFLKDMKEHE